MKAPPWNRAQRRGWRWRRPACSWLVAGALLGLIAGCGSDQLEFDYGRQDTSVNGALILARMFAASGRPVTTRHALTPGAAQAETIVWFPDSRGVPSEAAINWFNHWLSADTRRTLIFVGRDYDAEPDYWRQTAPLAPADQQERFAARKTMAEARLTAERFGLPAKAECDWFQFDGEQPAERAEKLSGPWAAGIDAIKAGIEIQQRLVPLDWQEPLLETPTDILVARDTPVPKHERGDEPRLTSGGQLLLVVNGSFLLNKPLVNPENRKLAGRLIEATDPGGAVVFLESNEDPQILSGDSPPSLPHSLDLLTVWPLNVLLLHFAVLGIIFCFARWPIFGRPEEPLPADRTNFGQHAEALGKLLERTADRPFAERRLAEYRALKL